jgi:uncharacterized protein (UPF0212 family)
MPVSLKDCSKMLAAEAVRHHVDEEEQAIRIAFVTRSYRNLRGEKLAIVRLETLDDGHRCRVSIERAFGCGSDPAATCMLMACLAAETPLVHAEYDADFENLRMVVETVIEDGTLTQLQLMSMIDRLVDAAEVWQASVERVRAAGRAAA